MKVWWFLEGKLIGATWCERFENQWTRAQDDVFIIIQISGIPGVLHNKHMEVYINKNIGKKTPGLCS